MRIRVLLFGAVREAVGAKELEVRLEAGASLGALRTLLAGQHTVFADYGERLMAAVNQQTHGDDCLLNEGDEVAFLPPVSGGARVAASRTSPWTWAAWCSGWRVPTPGGS